MNEWNVNEWLNVYINDIDKWYCVNQWYVWLINESMIWYEWLNEWYDMYVLWMNGMICMYVSMVWYVCTMNEWYDMYDMNEWMNECIYKWYE